MSPEPRHLRAPVGGPASPSGVGNQVFVTVLIGLALLVAPFVRAVLPEPYLLDDGHIRHTMEGSAFGSTAESFQAVADTYVLLGLDASPGLAALLGIAVYAVALVAAAGWDRLRGLRGGDLVVLVLALGPAMVYLAQYSKEFATLAVTLVLLALPAGRTRGGVLVAEAALLAAMLAYAGTLRPYWALVAVFYVVLRVLLPRTAHPLLLLAVPVVGYAMLQPAFQALLGLGLQGNREWSNAERGADVASVGTLITSIAPEATGAVGVGAAVVMLLLMVVPVPLLVTGNPVHLAAALLFLVLWALVLVPVLRGRLVRHEGTEGAPGAVTLPSAVRVRATRAAALLLAFLLVQALFEPDYGSALKHLAPLLPLLLLVHLAPVRAPEDPGIAATAARAPAAAPEGAPA